MTLQLRIALYLIVGLLLAVGLWYGGRKVMNHFEEFDQLKQYRDAAEQVGAGTEGAINTAGKKAGDVQRVEVVVTQRRAEAEAEFDQWKKEDESIAQWADGRIPVQLRERERARRAASDRPTDAAVGSEAAGTTEAR